MSDTPAVSVQRLQKRYGSTLAVAEVSFQVEPGQIYGVLGPNGAGKTTTLHCICTLLRPDAGQVEVCGIPVQQNPKAVREKLGFVAQEVALDKVLTGRELLQLQADIYHMPRPLAQKRIATVLQLLGLTDRAEERIGTYSGGLRKRLDLAAGLLHRPQVLVLDEPTVGLDIQSRLVIWDFLRQLKGMGITVLLSSHYLEEIDLLADRVAIIDRGSVIAEGTPEELKARVGGERITLKLQEFAPKELAERGAELLGSLPFVQQVLINSAQGNALNLVVQSHGEADPLGQIRSHLQTHGLELFSSAQSRPSLDDVYLAATGQTLLDAELAAAEANPGKQKK
ncbi:ATP-binding cassette domain-containing protein [Synechococcus sp. Nb3U1]|uniref:ABC transporter ATP-binding protein n=1 Tax=Synechococcus sp. Nb3U1 TaxID=1914529 RepID=UPI001F1B0D7E|nr:ATP-binding cassette domain-containing protein [Synechococcus sp. Nb3U1]MCF2970106.1 ATP-binding cassette domain-containing protein [Synechococcus sp. Nb3U1]